MSLSGHKSGDNTISEHRKPRNEQRAEADLALRVFLARKFREHPLSKPQIADRLAELLGEPVSLSRLDSYTASTKISARLPAYFLRALCEVLDSDDILLFLARPRLQKQIELAEELRELRRLCDELLRTPDLKTKHAGSSSPEQSNLVPANQKRNGSCAQ